MNTYDQARSELLSGIPGLLEMSVLDGLAAIDVFCQTWVNPSNSFNPWRWFQITKHNQAYPITLD